MTIILDEYQMEYGQAPQPVSLYPFNPYEPPPPFSAPPPLPGFEDSSNPPLPAPPLPPESGEGAAPAAADNEDMEISDRSDSGSKPPSPTADAGTSKRDMDMDCTMTSDEEEGITRLQLTLLINCIIFVSVKSCFSEPFNDGSIALIRYPVA